MATAVQDLLSILDLEPIEVNLFAAPRWAGSVCSAAR
jgi:hypothetical protein